MAGLLHRTAQPPTLATFRSWGSSAGAGRVRPADANIYKKDRPLKIRIIEIRINDLTNASIKLAVDLTYGMKLVITSAKRPKINEYHVCIFCFPCVTFNF